MIPSNLLGSKPSNNKLGWVAGATAIAGVALILASPKMRKACGNWVSNAISDIKNRVEGRASQNRKSDWERDMATAETLKGPVEKRKNASKIQVPSAGTTAWKDEQPAENAFANYH